MKQNMMGGIRQAIIQEMRNNSRMFMIGEDITKGCFAVTKDLQLEFGEERVIDSPISEHAIVGATIGAAAMGMTAMTEMMLSDFMTTAMDELVNQAAKMRYMFGGQSTLNLTVRFPGGVCGNASAQHSQSLEGLLAHVPGLKVIYPSDAADAAGLMVQALRDPNPVMFFEHKSLYYKDFEVPYDENDQIEPIPFGKAAVKRQGKDITLIATGMMIHYAQEAAENAAKDGVEVEIIDPRSLFPFDKEAVYESLEKTGKLLIVTEECKRGAWSAECLSRIAEEKFNLLKKAPVRIGGLDTPVPFSAVLEDYFVPRVVDIEAGIKKLLV